MIGFHAMEDRSTLDVSVCMYALHYVLLPRIQRNLTVFANGWNCYDMDLLQGCTPLRQQPNRYTQTGQKDRTKMYMPISDQTKYDL